MKTPVHIGKLTKLERTEWIIKGVTLLVQSDRDSYRGVCLMPKHPWYGEWRKIQDEAEEDLLVHITW